MKRALLFYVVCIAFGLSAAASAMTGREVTNLNREWRYMRGDDARAMQTEYDDTTWEAVGIPHSFSIPYFLSKEFYTGYGWYRKELTLKKEDLKKRLFLEFDGVFQIAEVYVNGVLAGSHTGGYTGFSIDITDQAKAGENLIAVRVNNLWNPIVAPRGGEHVFSGGIYRNVRLVKKEAVHLEWYGTFVTTPTLAKNNGSSSAVQVESTVKNAGRQDGTYRLEISVQDGNGRTVASCNKEQQVIAGGAAQFVLTTPEIARPSLWSPEQPALYTLESKLYEGKRLLDSERITFGFRWFEWTADRGFFLNGEHYYFHGANVHQDQAGWGDAVTEAASIRDVQMVKEAGFNMIRGSHYPHSPAFSEACDREGVLFWSEAPFWATAGPKDDGTWMANAYPLNPAHTEAFEESALQQLEEMIRIHRNHPSIFVWSMCNEPFFTDDRTFPGLKRLLKRMVERTHQLDPTRKAAIGGSQRPVGKERIDLLGDVAGYNGDGASIADFQNPGIPSVVSEHGGTYTDRPGEYTHGWGDLARNDAWKGVNWRSGHALWCAFDHGSIFGYPMGKLGIVDYFRIPKRSWYWYRNEFAHIAPPAWAIDGTPDHLHLQATKTKGIATDGTDDTHLTITVKDAEGRDLNSTPTVTLRIVDGPGEFPTGKSITFGPDSDICIQDGKAAITLRSYYAGKTVVEAVATGIRPARLTLEFVGDYPYKKGVSREVESRPYIRFRSTAEGKEIHTYGVNSPTFTSSSKAGHGNGMATDGNVATCWQPDEQDENPWIKLDVERTLVMVNMAYRFRTNDVDENDYKIETSADDLIWETLPGAQVTVNNGWIELKPKEPVRMRYVRFSFRKEGDRSQQNLAEIQVKGAIAEW